MLLILQIYAAILLYKISEWALIALVRTIQENRELKKRLTNK